MKIVLTQNSDFIDFLAKLMKNAEVFYFKNPIEMDEGAFCGGISIYKTPELEPDNLFDILFIFKTLKGRLSGSIIFTDSLPEDILNARYILVPQGNTLSAYQIKKIKSKNITVLKGLNYE